MPFLSGVSCSPLALAERLSHPSGKRMRSKVFSGVCRWGDYAGASPDPVAGATGGTVWMANQYNVASTTSNNVDWRTWIFNVVS